MKLGELSAKYESNGDPGAIAHTKGDKGGPSYGMYQLAMNTGSLEAYLRASDFRHQFVGLKPGTPEFDAQWRAVAKIRPNDFAEDQYDYHMGVYYTPVRAACDIWGIPDTNAINQVIWSASTQHGPGWAKKAFKQYKGTVEEKQMIAQIYLLRMKVFQDSKHYNATEAARKVKESVLQRFRNEMHDAFALIV